MDRVIINQTKQTPFVDFDPATGVFEISGRSIPENTFDFYKPILNWLEEYAIKPQAQTRLKVYLEYFNTSSSKFILEIFKKLKPIIGKADVVVAWHYDEDDEEMMENGEDYQDVSGLDFEFVEVSEE